MHTVNIRLSRLTDPRFKVMPQKMEVELDWFLQFSRLN